MAGCSQTVQIIHAGFRTRSRDDNLTDIPRPKNVEARYYRERIYSPKSEYAHVTCDILDTSRGYPTNEDKIFTTLL